MVFVFVCLIFITRRLQGGAHVCVETPFHRMATTWYKLFDSNTIKEKELILVDIFYVTMAWKQG